LLARLRAFFLASEIFQSSLTTSDSIPLLDFLTELTQTHPELITSPASARLLSLCLYICFEYRRDPPSMRKAICLLTSVHDQFPAAYHDFVASATPEVQSFLSQLQLAECEEEEIAPPTDLLSRVRQTVKSVESESLEGLLARCRAIATNRESSAVSPRKSSQTTGRGCRLPSGI
jgi:hypothetical protein